VTVVATAGALDKSSELLLVVGADFGFRRSGRCIRARTGSEKDHVDGHIVLLQFLAHLDEIGGRDGVQGRADEEDDSGALVFVLTVFECKLDAEAQSMSEGVEKGDTETCLGDL
jgi:hypothetical protein